ncbi:MAG: Do family serine endopeptidase [Gemmatimonadota bacterium]
MFDPLRAKAKVLLYTSGAFLVGVGMTSGIGWTANAVTMPTVSDEPQLSQASVQPALDLSDAFVNISDAVTPAVVRIETQRQRTATRGRMQELPPGFREFFDLPGQPEGSPAPQIAGGSGFIVSKDGYILTNDHVISGADQIMVYLQDRREYRATLVGTDPTTDVAVIKIDDTDLPTLSFGNSDDVRVGEWVLAVGNPGFGSGRQLDYTVTAGIVSAKGRPLQLIQSELRRNPNLEGVSQFAIEDFIQTDAVINPGNSGGPLVGLRGQVVGINSAIASRTGYYQGYGFAVPVNLARRVMEDLIEYGQVRRPWIGIQITDVETEDAEVYNLPHVGGVLIQDFPDGSPALGGGLEAEDVIVAIDGQPVDRVPELQRRVAQKRPGDRIRVEYYRDGRLQETTVRLAEAPLQPRPARVEASAPRAEEKLGISVMNLTPEVNERLNYPEASGVIIESVQPNGPAHRREVSRWLKIEEINRTPVDTADDVKAILDEVGPGDVVTLSLVDPLGARQVVNVRVPR